MIFLCPNPQCWDDICVPAWLTWHTPACNSWGGSMCVHMCLRMERPEVRVVSCWGLLSSSTFLHEPEFLAELASHCFGWINRTAGVWNPPVFTPASLGYGHTAQHLALYVDLNSGYADVESNLPSELYSSWEPPFMQSACETQENMPLGN